MSKIFKFFNTKKEKVIPKIKRIYPNTKVKLKDERLTPYKQSWEIAVVDDKRHFIKNGFEPLYTFRVTNENLEMFPICAMLNSYTDEEMSKVLTCIKNDFVYWIFPRAFEQYISDLNKDYNVIRYSPFNYEVWDFSDRIKYYY